MANLRTNNLSGEQGQNAIRGSVNFGGYVDGSASDYLSVADNDDLDMGTGDFTFECWLLAMEHVGTNTPNPMGIISSQSWTAGGILIQVRGSSDPSGVLRVVVPLSGGGYLDVNGSTDFYNVQGRDWVHIAVVRTSGTLKGYVNGIQEISTSYSVAVDFAHGGTCTIGENGYDQYPGDYSLRGTISNLRLTKGLARYTSTFTPPAFELTADADTVLLCCQNSDDVTQEETGKTITGVGNLATADYNKSLPKVIPPYGVDAGNTFGGPIQQSSQGYMYFPTGGTGEKGRGRAVIAGAYVDSPGAALNEIDFLSIQSMGNATTFGDLTTARWIPASFSSSTRLVTCGGATPTYINTIDFVTIATTSNATDFGDLSGARTYFDGHSNQTRGLTGGGRTPSSPNNTDTIDLLIIASKADATDFGNLTAAKNNVVSSGSPTRGLFMGGETPTRINNVDFVTLATTGDAADFGDLTSVTSYGGAVSSNTRVVYAGGYVPSLTNKMEFFTTASAGNGTDFGDLITARVILTGSSSNGIRGVIPGGYSGSDTNVIEFITIASNGNGKDFGDLNTAKRGLSGSSDSHGGLT